MKCLKIHDRWLRLILSKQKDVELRRTPCRIRERVALGNTKTGLVEGYATIVDSREFSIKQLKRLNHRHHANTFIDAYAVGKDSLYVWFFNDVETEPNPYPYSFSTGSWCFATKQGEN